MENLNVTGQELNILQIALSNFKKQMDNSEFKSNSIFTKEFFISHINTLNIKIEKLQEKLELANNN